MDGTLAKIIHALEIRGSHRQRFTILNLLGKRGLPPAQGLGQDAITVQEALPPAERQRVVSVQSKTVAHIFRAIGIALACAEDVVVIRRAHAGKVVVLRDGGSRIRHLVRPGVGCQKAKVSVKPLFQLGLERVVRC